ncbi:MAG: cytochrome c oxidase subunit II, partial [Gemmataceae bacterium]
MGKGWSVFFGVVLLATFLIWFVAPFYGWWLPDAVSTFGPDVDWLFYLILWFTGFFFVLTEVVLVYAMWRFAYRPGEKATYTHGNHLLEMVWTAIPAAILLGIAVVQITVWQDIKYQAQMPAPDVTVSVMARQWEWRMRYPVATDRFTWKKEADKDAVRERMLAARGWAENAEIDDVHVANEIHTWAGANTKIYLRTQDVLHSFTMPNMRVKQDTLPGKTIPMWFKATRSNTAFDPATRKLREPADRADTWEIACQELCGGRHYAMRG